MPELLRTFGIEQSDLAQLIDGRPLGGDETQALSEILFRLRDIPLVDLQRNARKQPEWAELGQGGARFRGEVYALAGRAVRVETLQPAPEAAERLDLAQYYRCRLVLDSGQPAEVFARRVPRHLEGREPIHDPVGAYAVLLKFGPDDDGGSIPVFAAPRLAWYPDTLLGRLGMDVGLLDEVEDRKRLTGNDRECFYQMLAAAERARPGQLSREARRKLKQADPSERRVGPDGEEHYSVEPLFNDPVNQRGRPVELSGTARRVVRIRVDDQDIKRRFGIDHYYSVFLFTDDSQSNPVVFCVRSLPAGMSPGTGPRYARRVRIAGFFMKTWAYRVRRPEKAPAGRDGRLQLAPLLIGRQLRSYPQQPPAANTTAQAIAGGLFLLVLVAVWMALWRYGRGDKRFRQQTMARIRSEPPKTALEKIDQNASGKEFP